MWKAAAVLADGTYEAIVVDTEGAVLSLAITAGEGKGEVVEVQAAHIHDPFELLAMPCILVVAEGQPSVVFD